MDTFQVILWLLQNSKVLKRKLNDGRYDYFINTVSPVELPVANQSFLQQTMICENLITVEVMENERH